MKVGATRTYYDVQLAVKAGADVIVVDGMQGGTAATQDVFIEHVGIPTLPATRIAVEALQELGMHRQVQLIVSGGIRSGADVAKALALGADAVSIGTAALVAMGDNAPEHDEAYREIGSAAGFYDDWQAGRDPTGISTQDDELAARFDPILGGRRIANYLRVLTLETQTLARACGKSHVHNLEPEDLVALTVEAAAMAKVPLAGTDWIPGTSPEYGPSRRVGTLVAGATTSLDNLRGRAAGAMAVGVTGRWRRRARVLGTSVRCTAEAPLRSRDAEDATPSRRPRSLINSPRFASREGNPPLDSPRRRCRLRLDLLVVTRRRGASRTRDGRVRLHDPARTDRSVLDGAREIISRVHGDEGRRRDSARLVHG